MIMEECINELKRLLRIVLIALYGVALIGCKTVCITDYKDITITDTVYVVDSDTITEQIYVECDSDLTPIIVYKEINNSNRGKIESESELVDKTLTIKNQAIIDSLQIEVRKYKEKVIESKTETVYVDKPISSYYRFCSWWFICSILLMILVIVIKIIKIIY